MKLRNYQNELVADIYRSWQQGARNVCAVLPTGGGKTITFGRILLDHKGASCAVVHRRELVGQMSVTLARLGVRHRIIAPSSVISEIVALHLRETGRSWHDSNAHCGVASVDTLIRRDRDPWMQQVTLWVCDEMAHLLAANKWGRALALFPNARGLGVTATPLRADGKGLGRHADGLMDVLVQGPDMRALIDQGYLAEYRVFAPKTDLDRSQLPVSDSSGDFSPTVLRDAVKRSHITGDIVDSYRAIASGKLGLTFTVSVDLAAETAARFRQAGVPAECVSADTPDRARADIMRRFERREILQLVNVDLFGEGYDCPAIEVVSMGRPTESYGLYVQQFGRACRVMEGKPHALIIDHTGNVLRHGLPDAPRVWSLDRRERRSKATADGPPLIRACAACTRVYERYLRACPHCGEVPVPASRAAPEHVDGDLLEMDAGLLARLRGQSDLMRAPSAPYGASPIIVASVAARHRERVAAQHALRAQIAWWAGWQQSLGRSDSEGYRRFYLTFGVDVATAQTLSRADAEALSARIGTVLTGAGISTAEGIAA